MASSPRIVVFLLSWFAGPFAVGSDGIDSSDARTVTFEEFGAAGDGISDDTEKVQDALTKCSTEGLSCVVSPGKTYLIRKPLFLWGEASLVGDGSDSGFAFEVSSAPYLVNIGLSGVQRIEQPFSGRIAGVRFEVRSGESGRILFFWRTKGASIEGNRFFVGNFRYSATSSGNDNRWVTNCHVRCIREDIKIVGNTVNACATNKGSEGLGLGNFDGAKIERNSIYGVGDDPIGIHFSRDVLIRGNNLRSVDGRIFVANSQAVIVQNNLHRRVPSCANGQRYRGIALIYVGFEGLGDNSYSAPRDVVVTNNVLVYPAGSIDSGAAIRLEGVKDAMVSHNKVFNNSFYSMGVGLLITGASFTGEWREPGLKEAPQKTASSGALSIESNRFLGAYPLPIVVAGRCGHFSGQIAMKDNTAGPQNLASSFYRLWFGVCNKQLAR